MKKSAKNTGRKLRKKRKKNIGRTLIMLLLIIVIALASMFISTIKKPLKISELEVVNVEEGDSFYSVINSLSNEKKIKSPFIIKIYAKLTGLNLEVVPGSHTLEKGMSVKDIAKTLKDTNNANAITLTIPEGFNVENIATRVAEKDICTKDEFLTAVKNYPLPSYVKDNPDKRYNLEGFLFPDTYNFKIGVEPEYIIETMIKRFEGVWSKITEGLDIVEKIYNEASIKPEEVDETTGELVESDGIKQFETYPVITSATVDTHGENFGLPEVLEAFDYNAYMSELLSSYYGTGE